MPPYWSYLKLPDYLATCDIDLLEALALVSAAKSLAHFIQGKTVLFEGVSLHLLDCKIFFYHSVDSLVERNLSVLTDNKPVEGAFAKKMATKWETQSLIRHLLLWAARSNTYFYVQYINTKDNILADPLSRLRVDKFWHNAKSTKISMNIKPSLFLFGFGMSVTVFNCCYVQHHVKSFSIPFFIKPSVKDFHYPWFELHKISSSIPGPRQLGNLIVVT